MDRIRTAVKALILHEGKLLLNHCSRDDGEYYALPGGGQHVGETLDEALIRECREEIGSEVRVGALTFVRDHIVSRHDLSYVHETKHQLELLFLCTLLPGEEPRLGPEPDHDQIGVAWLDAAEMEKVRVLPSWLVEFVHAGGHGVLSVYQGDRN